MSTCSLHNRIVMAKFLQVTFSHHALQLYSAIAVNSCSVCHVLVLNECECIYEENGNSLK